MRRRAARVVSKHAASCGRSLGEPITHGRVKTPLTLSLSLPPSTTVSIPAATARLAWARRAVTTTRGMIDKRMALPSVGLGMLSGEEASEDEMGRSSRHKEPSYLEVNVLYPGVRAISTMPPVYTVDNFLSHEECNALIEAVRRRLS